MMLYYVIVPDLNKLQMINHKQLMFMILLIETTVDMAINCDACTYAIYEHGVGSNVIHVSY